MRRKSPNARVVVANAASPCSNCSWCWSSSACLAAVAVPQVLNYLGGARTDAAGLQVQQLSATLDLYRLDAGRYPNQDEGLDALLVKPGDAKGWNGPYVKKEEMLVDPWGNRFVYRFPGEHGAYDLFSLGADGEEGGEDEDQDVVSW